MFLDISAPPLMTGDHSTTSSFHIFRAWQVIFCTQSCIVDQKSPSDWYVILVGGENNYLNQVDGCSGRMCLNFGARSLLTEALSISVGLAALS